MRLPQLKTAGGGGRGEGVCFFLIKSSLLPITFDALVTGMVIVDNVEGVRLLLADPRLDPNQKNNDGHAPVMIAMFFCKVDILRELVAHQSVDLDTRNRLGWSLEEMARAR